MRRRGVGRGRSGEGLERERWRREGSWERWGEEGSEEGEVGRGWRGRGEEGRGREEGEVGRGWRGRVRRGGIMGEGEVRGGVGEGE